MRTDFSRFSDPGLLILASLAAEPRHGYAMMRDIAQFSGTHLEPGTLYGALTRLEAQGWIQPLPTEDRRRPYALTVAGATALRNQLATLRAVATIGWQRLEAR